MSSSFTGYPWRRLAAILAAVVGVVVLIALAGVAWLQSPPGRRYVTSRLQSLLADRQIQLSDDELSYNLFAMSLAIRNLRVQPVGRPDMPTFVTVDHGRVDLSLWSLLRGRYVVQSGAIDGVTVHYFVDEQGRDNVPRPLTDSPRDNAPLNYLISQLTVNNARVRYENRARDLDAVMPVQSISVEGHRFTDRHEITFASRAGHLRIDDRMLGIERLSGTIDLGRDDVTSNGVQLVADGINVTLNGTLKDFAAPDANLRVQGTVDAARVASLANVDESIGGTATVDARLRGMLATAVVGGRVSSSDFRFRTLEAVALDAQGQYDLGTRALSISDLNVDSPYGGVSGAGAIYTAGTDSSKLDLQLKGLDAGRVMQAFALRYTVASRVDGAVAAEWPGLAFRAASGTASLRLSPTPASRRALALGGRVDISARDGAGEARLSGVRALGALLDGRATLNRSQTLGGMLQARVDDVGQTVAAVENLTGRPRGSLLPAPVSGPATAAITLAGSIRAPGADAMVSLPSLRIGAAAPTAVSAQLAYRPDALQITRVDASWQDARLRADGRIGLAGRSRPLDLRVTGDSVHIEQVLAAAGHDSIPASGLLSFNATVMGDVSRPVGTVAIEGEDVVAYGEHLGMLSGTATLTGAEVVVNTLTLDKPQPTRNGQLTARGRYDLERRAYSVDVTSNNVKLLTLDLPNGQRVTGDVDLTASATGTIEQPVGTVNLNFANLDVGSRPIGQLTVESRLAGGTAKIHSTAARFNATADATIGIARPYPATINVRVDGLDLDALPVEIETPLTGTVRASLDATGDLANPAAAMANAVIDAFTGTWRGQPFSIDAPAMLRYAAERVQIDRLTLKAQDSTVTLTGDVPLTERAGDGTLTLDARANLATLAQYAPVGTDVAADGTLTLGGTVSGRRHGNSIAVIPNLNLAIDNGLVLSRDIEPGLSSLTLRAHIGDGQATIDQLSAGWGAARIQMMAMVPFDILPELPFELPRNAGPASITASVQDLDPAALPGVPSTVGGLISFEAHATTASANLNDLTGEIVFPDLQLTVSGLTLAQSEPSTVRLANGAAQVERFDLSGSLGTLRAAGSVGLAGARPLDLTMSGQLQIGIVSVLEEGIQAEGQGHVEIAARGTVANPDISGFISVEDGNIVMDEPDLVAAGIWGRVDFAGRQAILSQLTAELNGGSLTGWGSAELGSGGLSAIDIGLNTDDFAFDAPLDLRSLSDSNFRITRVGSEIHIDGDVTIEEAGLTGDINFDTGLLATINARQTLDLTEQRNALLDSIRFNIGVVTAAPILIENNLARAEVDVNVRVLGSPYETGLSGDLRVLEDGQVSLNERTYQVERGVITFVDERAITPAFDLRLTTTVSNYDIVVMVSGPLSNTETTLTSTPAMPEPDIMAVLVTGRTLDEMRGEEYEVAREQVLSYLTGRLGSTLGRGLQQATGLSTVRLEPNLIANETDPSARLTVGQELTDKLEFVYSTDLAQSNDQIWMLRYALGRRFQSNGVRQADNSYRVDFRHDLRFGGVPEPRRVIYERRQVSDVIVESDAMLPEAELRHTLGVDEGDTFDFFRARNGAQRLEQRLTEQGFLQARVRLRRMIEPDGVRLTLRVIEGPHVDILFSGATPPGKIAGEVRRQWMRGVFDIQRADDGREALRAWLLESGFLQPMIESAIEDVAPGQRRVTFTIATGPHYGETVLAFNGASAVSPSTLEDIVHSQELDQKVFTDPIVVTELLQRYYHDQGYLAAEIDTPRYEYAGSVARVVMDVREGPLFTVRELTTSGNRAVTREELLPAIPMAPGDPFLPFAAENALNGIRNLYWKQGYNDVRPNFNLTKLPAGRVDVTFTIDEGPRTVVTEIDVAGRDKTSERLVLGELEVKADAPLDLTALSRSRQNLYKSGAFSLVDITRTAQPAETLAPAPEGTASSDVRPVQLTVNVREVQPYQLRYGASYDTERAAGAIFDVSGHNIIGKARVLGLQSRYDRQLREARLYLSQPSLLRAPLQTTFAMYIRSERNPSTEVSDAFGIDRLGMSIQQERKLKDNYVGSYGFRYEKARTSNERAARVPSATVSPFTATLTREARDEVLDATRGSFLSHAFVYSPSWLRVDQPFIKYFAQYFHYFPLQRERRERFTNELLRPRLVFATGARVGLARGIGGEVPTSERFFAGGSTSMRGFAQNAVGPIGPGNVPTGGNMLLLLNNELRFPLVKWFDGVGFVDIGNAWNRIGDFSFTDLRQDVGVGLRVRTPWFLVRGDYGVAVDPRPGESRSRFFFSIGQAF